MALRALVWLGRLATNSTKLLSIVQVLIYLPLSLEVAGKSCFLGLSAALAAYFFSQSTTELLLRHTRLRFLSVLFGPTQVLVVPVILLVFLNLYHAPQAVDWLDRRLLANIPAVWETILRASTPLFVLAEGVSTLLVVQALGQISRYFIEERNESFQFAFLISSAATYVMSAFFLYDSYNFAASTPTSATLIGVSLTTVIFLTGIAFALKKGNVVETSLMMAYLTFQIYYLTDGPNPWLYLGSLQQSGPPQLVQSLSTIISFFSHIFGASLDFVVAAYSALPLPVIVSLAYRISILWAAAHVLLALRRAQTGYGNNIDTDDEDLKLEWTSLILMYSRFILVCVYTHLLLLNNTGSHVRWSWLNIFITLSLWAVELLLAKGESSANVVQGLRWKWKID